MKPDLAATSTLPTQSTRTAAQPTRRPVADSQVEPQPVGLEAVDRSREQEAPEARPTDIDSEQLAAFVESLNRRAGNIARQLRFQFDDDANRSVIKVYDRETEELIRQIPSEEVLERLRFRNSDVSLIDVEA
ncbi:MAG: flagellar protein FlaG [Pseudomonadota bacterium]